MKLWWFVIPPTVALVVLCIVGEVGTWWKGRGKP